MVLEKYLVNDPDHIHDRKPQEDAIKASSTSDTKSIIQLPDIDSLEIINFGPINNIREVEKQTGKDLLLEIYDGLLFNAIKIDGWI